MVLSTFVTIGKFVKDVWYIIWNELSYPILYLRKVYIFLWYCDEIKLYTKYVHPKILLDVVIREDGTYLVFILGFENTAFRLTIKEQSTGLDFMRGTNASDSVFSFEL